MKDQVARIREKLDSLRERDRNLSIFGAGSSHGHGYRERKALEDASVGHLESDLGVAFPSEVSEFLRYVHAGGPGPGYGLFFEPDPSTREHRIRPFPFGTAQTQALIETRLSGGDNRWATLDDNSEEGTSWPPGPGFIPLAHLGCGVFEVLVLAGEQRGFIWWHDSGWAPFHNEHGRQYTFLDWYELWLDESLRQLEKAANLRSGAFSRWLRKLSNKS